MTKDGTLYTHMATALSCLSCYDSDIKMIESYNENDTPFVSLWIGNEKRESEIDESMEGIKQRCESEFSIILVQKNQKRYNPSSQKKQDLDGAKDFIEFCLNKIDRNKQISIMDTLTTTKKQMDIYLQDIIIDEVFKTYPDNNSTTISILLEGRLQYLQINYFN